MEKWVKKNKFQADMEIIPITDPVSHSLAIAREQAHVNGSEIVGALTHALKRRFREWKRIQLEKSEGK